MAGNNNWSRGKRRGPREGRDQSEQKRSNRGGGNQRKSRAELHSPKRKYAIVFGYNGIGHHGMQRQIPGSPTAALPTIEGAMEKALVASGALTEEQIEEYFKIQWSRVGRTDAGVHATCQVVTAKISLGPLSVQAIENQQGPITNEDERMPETDDVEGENVKTAAAPPADEASPAENPAAPPADEASTAENPAFKQVITSQGPGIVDQPEEEENDFSQIQRDRELAFLKKLSANMPEGFEVFEVTRVANNFDARHNCSERQYEYYIPLKYFQEVELHDNNDVISKFFKKYGTGKIEVVDKFEDESQDKICLLTNEEKAELLKVVKDGTSLKTAWDLKTGRFGELCRRYRRELCWIRRLFSSLNSEERKNCWLELHGSLPEIYDNIPYAPPVLLSIRPRDAADFIPKDPEAFIKKVNEILARYEGHHNWFNYTSRIKSTDPSACRFMKSVKAYIASENTQIPMLVVRLLGSSFVLSQIRKMVTVLIETMIGTAPLAANVFLFEQPLEPKKHVHLAPGEMLMLERAIFETENRVTKTPITNLTFFDAYEQKYPHGEKMRELLKSGKYESIATRSSNPLADEPAPSEPEQLLYDWHEANRTSDSPEIDSFADIPVWFRILKFKFDMLIPTAWAKCEENHVFDQYINDLLWHPFFIENYPEPSSADYLKEIDAQIKEQPSSTVEE